MEGKPRSLILLRGLPGSGKSTLASQLVQGGGIVLSTDTYFETPRHGYLFNSRLLPVAHGWTQDRARQSVALGISPIVIDNTLVQAWEAKTYVQLAVDAGYSVQFVEPSTPWWVERNLDELARRNTHGVGMEALQRMSAKWEASLTVDMVLASQVPYV
ncbi:AAA domain-containing protein [Entophlyctis helioformis]|nr:AAA domain-containing protein [Entophlyctis helioformis]